MPLQDFELNNLRSLLVRSQEQHQMCTGMNEAIRTLSQETANRLQLLQWILKTLQSLCTTLSSDSSVTAAPEDLSGIKKNAEAMMDGLTDGQTKNGLSGKPQQADQ